MGEDGNDVIFLSFRRSVVTEKSLSRPRGGILRLLTFPFTMFRASVHRNDNGVRLPRTASARNDTLYSGPEIRATSKNPPLPPLSKGAYARRERKGIYGDYRWVSMMHAAQKSANWRYSAETPARASSGIRPTSSDSRMETPCEAACSFTTSNTVRGDVTL